jgi:2-keto-3-deoxy-L-rhamnonate aldolase RhmA
VGISRAHEYGLSFHSYMKRANDDIVLIVQCEHKESIKNLEDILKVEGIDSIFVGPYDLSASMGKTGQVKDKAVVANIEEIQSLCAKHNMPAGIFGGTPDAVKNYHYSGFNLVAVGIDMLMISQSAKGILSEMKDSD